MVSRHLLATPPQPTSEDLLWLTPNSAFIPRVAICHGDTYITSDNFPAQKIQSQNSVALHSLQLAPKAAQPIQAGSD